MVCCHRGAQQAGARPGFYWYSEDISLNIPLHLLGRWNDRCLSYQIEMSDLVITWFTCSSLKLMASMASATHGAPCKLGVLSGSITSAEAKELFWSQHGASCKIHMVVPWLSGLHKQDHLAPGFVQPKCCLCPTLLCINFIELIQVNFALKKKMVVYNLSAVPAPLQLCMPSSCSAGGRVGESPYCTPFVVLPAQCPPDT